MCPGTEKLNIEQNTEQTNGSTLEKTVQSYSDFLNSFAEKLKIQLHHSFIA
jgi:hypothetical protein